MVTTAPPKTGTTEKRVSFAEKLVETNELPRYISESESMLEMESSLVLSPKTSNVPDDDWAVPVNSPCSAPTDNIDPSSLSQMRKDVDLAAAAGDLSPSRSREGGRGPWSMTNFIDNICVVPNSKGTEATLSANLDDKENSDAPVDQFSERRSSSISDSVVDNQDPETGGVDDEAFLPSDDHFVATPGDEAFLPPPNEEAYLPELDEAFLPQGENAFLPTRMDPALLDATLDSPDPSFLEQEMQEVELKDTVFHCSDERSHVDDQPVLEMKSIESENEKDPLGEIPEDNSLEKKVSRDPSFLEHEMQEVELKDTVFFDMTSKADQQVKEVESSATNEDQSDKISDDKYVVSNISMDPSYITQEMQEVELKDTVFYTESSNDDEPVMEAQSSDSEIQMDSCIDDNIEDKSVEKSTSAAESAPEEIELEAPLEEDILVNGSPSVENNTSGSDSMEKNTSESGSKTEVAIEAPLDEETTGAEEVSLKKTTSGDVAGPNEAHTPPPEEDGSILDDEKAMENKEVDNVDECIEMLEGAVDSANCLEDDVFSEAPLAAKSASGNESTPPDVQEESERQTSIEKDSGTSDETTGEKTTSYSSSEPIKAQELAPEKVHSVGNNESNSMPFTASGETALLHLCNVQQRTEDAKAADPILGSPTTRTVPTIGDTPSSCDISVPSETRSIDLVQSTSQEEKMQELRVQLKQSQEEKTKAVSQAVKQIENRLKRDNMKEVVKVARSAKIAHSVQLNSRDKVHTQRQRELEEAQKEQVLKIAGVMKVASAIKNELAEEGDFGEMKTLKQSLGNLLSNQKVTIEMLQASAIEKDNEIASLTKQCKKSEDQEKSAQTSLRVAEKALISIKGELSSTRKKLREAEQGFGDASSELESCRKSVAVAKAGSELLRTQNIELRALASRHSDEAARNERTISDLKERVGHLQNTEETAKTLQEQNTSLKSKLEQMEGEVRELKENVGRLQNTEERAKTLQEQNASLKCKLEQMEGEVRELLASVKMVDLQKVEVEAEHEVNIQTLHEQVRIMSNGSSEYQKSEGTQTSKEDQLGPQEGKEENAGEDQDKGSRAEVSTGQVFAVADLDPIFSGSTGAFAESDSDICAETPALESKKDVVSGKQALAEDRVRGTWGLSCGCYAPAPSLSFPSGVPGPMENVAVDKGLGINAIALSATSSESGSPDEGAKVEKSVRGVVLEGYEHTEMDQIEAILDNVQSIVSDISVQKSSSVSSDCGSDAVHCDSKANVSTSESKKEDDKPQPDGNSGNNKAEDVTKKLTLLSEQLFSILSETKPTKGDEDLTKKLTSLSEQLDSILNEKKSAKEEAKATSGRDSLLIEKVGVFKAAFKTFQFEKERISKEAEEEKARIRKEAEQEIAELKLQLETEKQAFISAQEQRFEADTAKSFAEEQASKEVEQAFKDSTSKQPNLSCQEKARIQKQAEQEIAELKLQLEAEKQAFISAQEQRFEEHVGLVAAARFEEEKQAFVANMEKRFAEEQATKEVQQAFKGSTPIRQPSLSRSAEDETDKAKVKPAVDSDEDKSHPSMPSSIEKGTSCDEEKKVAALDSEITICPGGNAELQSALQSSNSCESISTAKLECNLDEELSRARSGASSSTAELASNRDPSSFQKGSDTTEKPVPLNRATQAPSTMKTSKPSLQVTTSISTDPIAAKNSGSHRVSLHSRSSTAKVSDRTRLVKPTTARSSTPSSTRRSSIQPPTPTGSRLKMSSQTTKNSAPLAKSGRLSFGTPGLTMGKPSSAKSNIRSNSTPRSRLPAPRPSKLSQPERKPQKTTRGMTRQASATKVGNKSVSQPFVEVSRQRVKAARSKFEPSVQTTNRPSVANRKSEREASLPAKPPTISTKNLEDSFASLLRTRDTISTSSKSNSATNIETKVIPIEQTTEPEERDDTNTALATSSALNSECDRRESEVFGTKSDIASATSNESNSNVQSVDIVSASDAIDRGSIMSHDDGISSLSKDSCADTSKSFNSTENVPGTTECLPMDSADKEVLVCKNGALVCSDKSEVKDMDSGLPVSVPNPDFPELQLLNAELTPSDCELEKDFDDSRNESQIMMSMSGKNKMPNQDVGKTGSEEFGIEVPLELERQNM